MLIVSKLQEEFVDIKFGSMEIKYVLPAGKPKHTIQWPSCCMYAYKYTYTNTVIKYVRKYMVPDTHRLLIAV